MVIREHPSRSRITPRPHATGTRTRSFSACMRSLFHFLRIRDEVRDVHPCRSDWWRFRGKEGTKTRTPRTNCMRMRVSVGCKRGEARREVDNPPPNNDAYGWVCRQSGLRGVGDVVRVSGFQRGGPRPVRARYGGKLARSDRRCFSAEGQVR